MATTKELILVTGATGLLGAQLVAKSLSLGYRVRGTVRKNEQIEKLKRFFSPQYESQVDFVIVDDLTKPGVYQEALKGVDYVLHTASPVVAQSTNWKDDHIDPAVKGTTNLLTAAKTFPQIKRVVVTNTFGSLMPLGGFEDLDHVMTEKDRDFSVADPNMDFPNPFVAYFASKILADKATHDFLATEKPHYSVVTLYLGYIYGKDIVQETAGSIRSSNWLMWGVLNGVVPPAANFDVHPDDAVEAHLRALDPKIETGEGFLVAAPPFLWEDAIAIAKREMPGHEWKLASPSTEDMKKRKIDTSKAEKVLGIKFKPFETQLKDLLQMQKELSLKGTAA